MLYLHHSNQLERLALHFAALQRIDPLSPLEEEQVVVQNIGMGRWLSLKTAEFNGIAANIRYLFPAEMTWELLRAVLGDDEVPQKDPCAPATLRWRLLDVFLREPQAWPELSYYLETGPEACWQLAGQFSKVFDQYLFFRPDWIREWESGGAQADDWQARLWQRIAGEHHLPHWVRLQERFVNALPLIDKDKLPERITFFSVPVLSPGYVQLLGEVAKHVDIHIYLMNPCKEYWGDIESAKRKHKQQPGVQEYISIGNPLLASWGRQGRDFLDMLVEAQADIDDLSLFVEPDESTLLGRVQADILYLREPGRKETPPNPPLSGEGQAGSPFAKGGGGGIFFHACHSPMREVEVLYDQLLALFATHPDLKPADVVVMTPDIDAYAPYLDAVFSTAQHPLPYSIADRSPGYAQSILNLCEQLLELPQSRFDAESVLALLEFREVREHLGLDEAQVARCREWIRAVNIRWGSDAASRVQQGGADTPEHTWRYGLDRLLLGYALPGDELFAEVLPWDGIEGSQAEVLGHLQQALEAVFELSHWARQAYPLAEWDERFRRLLQKLTGEDAPLQSVWLALDRLQQAQEQADFEQPLAWPVFRSALAEQLDKRSESEGFLGRGITFCALMPMRTVPFRFVALIGMNEGVFPRRDVRASFDRMGHSMRRGDRLKRDEDRYLFLESILSARDWLYISYVGQSQRDNSELPPSILVGELLDYLAEVAPGSSTKLRVKHPLQAFSRRYLHAEESLFTYNAYWPDSAEGQEKPVCLPFWDTPCVPELQAEDQRVTLSELIRFFQHPGRAFLLRRFGLRPGERVEELPAREPFTLENYSGDEIRARVFQQLRQGLPVGQVVPVLRAEGMLPHGEPGQLLFAKEATVAENFFASLDDFPEMHSQSFETTLGEFQLYGVIDNLTASGRHVYALGNLSYWSWLDIWLKHLALSLPADGGLPRVTQVFSPDSRYCLEPVEDAHSQLKQLLAWYWQGLQEPLPFFPKSGLKLMEMKEPDVSRVMSTWEGSGGFSGEGEKPEYRLLYRGDNPLKTHEEDFTRIAAGVFGHMLAARRELKS